MNPNERAAFIATEHGMPAIHGEFALWVALKNGIEEYRKSALQRISFETAILDLLEEIDDDVPLRA